MSEAMEQDHTGLTVAGPVVLDLLAKLDRRMDQQRAAAAVVDLLAYVGEDPDREGLRDTPRRVTAALREMTSGYQEEPGEILALTFDEAVPDQIILLAGIEFTSLCEHHLFPFVGTATVGYLPGDCIVGLSKLARLVDCFARRLQIQERLTDQVAQAIQTHLHPRAVGVIVRAHHACMGCRGVKKPSALMVTSTFLGAFRDNATARAEFLALERSA